jgi:hypothetical protein
MSTLHKLRELQNNTDQRFGISTKEQDGACHLCVSMRCAHTHSRAVLRGQATTHCSRRDWGMPRKLCACTEISDLWDQRQINPFVLFCRALTFRKSVFATAIWHCCTYFWKLCASMRKTPGNGHLGLLLQCHNDCLRWPFVISRELVIPQNATSTIIQKKIFSLERAMPRRQNISLQPARHNRSISGRH